MKAANKAASSLQMRLRRARVIRDYRKQGKRASKRCNNGLNLIVTLNVNLSLSLNLNLDLNLGLNQSLNLSLSLSLSPNRSLPLHHHQSGGNPQADLDSFRRRAKNKSDTVFSQVMPWLLGENMSAGLYARVMYIAVLKTVLCLGVQACKNNFLWVVAMMLDLNEDPNHVCTKQSNSCLFSVLFFRLFCMFICAFCQVIE